MKKKTELKANAKLNSIARIRNKLVWTTALGDDVVVKDMRLSHLQNTIMYLAKKIETWKQYGVPSIEYVINGMLGEEWIEIFKDELEYRITNNLLEDTSID
jgi:hypothetical protein